MNFFQLKNKYQFLKITMKVDFAQNYTYLYQDELFVPPLFGIIPIK